MLCAVRSDRAPPLGADMPCRDEIISRLRSGQEFDVLVVGGGCTGAGAALDGALRGLNVACVEREDFSSGTSSRSTKLIWAGSRYLVQALVKLFSLQTLKTPIKNLKSFLADFRMVRNCHRERAFLLEHQPHLTHWRAVAVPMTRWLLWPPPFSYPPAVLGPMGLFSLFFKFYDGLSGFSCPSSHVLSKKRAARIFPQLNADALKYSQVFYEGQHNDARTNIAIALSAAQAGAAISNYVEVVELLKEESGKVTGVIALDRCSGEKFEILAKSTLFCGGPFTDELRKLEDPDCTPAVAGAAGIHVVLPSYYCAKSVGLVDMATSDGRFLFFLPWLGHCLVGTTDSPQRPSMRPVPAEEEIQWICNEASKYLDRRLKVRRSDVLSAWSGIRPLVRDPNASSSAEASRDHTISVEPTTQTVFVAGGKWTTYREMAEEAIDAVVQLKNLEPRDQCSTLKHHLLGYDGWHKNLAAELVQEHHCSHEVGVHLASTYGGRAHDVLRLSRPTGQLWPKKGVVLVDNYPYIEAEVVYACRYEMACNAEDIIARRTRLAFLNVAAARTALPRVVDIMAQELGWDEKRVTAEIKKTQGFMDTFGGTVPVQEKDKLKATMKQLETIRSVFDQIDQDQNGVLDENEVQKLVLNLGFTITSTELKAAMFRMGANPETGTVGFEEFVTWWSSGDDKLASVIHSQMRIDTADHYSEDIDMNQIGIKGNSKARGVLFG